MDTLDTNPLMYDWVVRTALELEMPGIRGYKFGELIFLAHPSYMVWDYSPCPMTSMDGYDMVEESEQTKRRMRKLHDYDEENIIKDWKGDNPRYVKQVVPLNQKSIEFLIINGFVEVPQHFPIIFHTYAYAEEPNVH